MQFLYATKKLIPSQSKVQIRKKHLPSLNLLIKTKSKQDNLLRILLLLFCWGIRKELFSFHICMLVAVKYYAPHWTYQKLNIKGGPIKQCI